MHTAVRGCYRATRPPFPGSWLYPERFFPESLAGCSPEHLRPPIPPHFQEQPGAVQDKSFLAADVRLPGGQAKPLGQVALPAPIGLKVNHFLPFGKDGPVSRRVGGGAPHEEQRGSDVR